MNGHMGPMCTLALALLRRFNSDYWRTDDDIAQQGYVQFYGEVRGKTKHVGGSFFAPVITVQLCHFIVVDQSNTDFDSFQCGSIQ